MSNPAITLEGFETLSDDWYVLRKYRVRHRRRDGSEQSYSREAYDRGNGAAILLYDPARGTVFLTRQFRLPAYVNGHADGMLMEVPAGLLDSDAPADAIRREAEEEAGFTLPAVEEVFTAYMSPGSVTERLHFFVAAVTAEARTHAGGGNAEEGEEIETIELPLGQALAMIRDGRIQDGKTIMLLQHAALAGLIAPPCPAP
ncbi:NUDIX domain-containing protein [Radicibacter daui]|uniref:NUDIX domain-containing protein n=1 Tax=Radicibacter daui TaxID=3064829 RepID=UPI004046C912